MLCHPGLMPEVSKSLLLIGISKVANFVSPVPHNAISNHYQGIDSRSPITR